MPTETPRKQVPSFDDWVAGNDCAISDEWQLIHDEYGDAAPLLSRFKEQRYREFGDSLSGRD